jgi:hypothetical protein
MQRFIPYSDSIENFRNLYTGIVFIRARLFLRTEGANYEHFLSAYQYLSKSRKNSIFENIGSCSYLNILDKVNYEEKKKLALK